MKKYYLLAIAAITTLFTACNSDDDVIGGEETRGVVKTEFTISFPAKAAGSTRMTTATVQGQTPAVFRGIQDIKLYPFKAKVANISTTTDLPGVITLTGGTVTTFGASGTSDNYIANSGALFDGNNAHLYKDIEIAIGTKAFMFYGLAIPGGVSNFADGTLSDNLSSASTLGDITFSPVQIHSSGTVGTNGTSIATYLTGIANSKYTDGSSVDHYWSASDNVILKTLYDNFITMKPGSWTSVKAAVQQLYTSLYGKTFAAEADNLMKTAILNSIKNATYAADADGGSADGTLEFQTLGNYPADIHLPDGAAYINWTGSAFEAINFPEYDNGTVLDSGTSLVGYYTKSGDVYIACTSGTADGTTTYYKKISDNTGLDIPNLNKYVYPAPLYYRVLSDIRTSQKSLKDVYESKTTWDDDHTNLTTSVIDAYYNEANGVSDEVFVSTRSIAIEKQVQYAVGRLDATVQANAAQLEDNEGTSFDLSKTEGGNTTYYFPVTGILIGGQKAVDYKFEQKSSSEAFTIYDNVFDGTIYLKSTTPTDADKTHTLVFETKAATADDDPDCVTKIAVEFQNNSGQIIVGRDNTLILPGTKFYLVGTFDPYDNTSHYYSGYSSGTENLIKKTFVQDYTTTANLVIKSLKNAYNTLPDLRSPKLELGLSVDLTWLSGITQTIEIE